MKHISEMRSNYNEIELFETPSFHIVGKYTRISVHDALEESLEFNRKCREDGTIDLLKTLPCIIPNSLIGWEGDHQPDNSIGIMWGVITTDWNVPEGLVAKGISSELSSTVIAKGIYGKDSMSIINNFGKLGYESPYHGINCVGWWEGELYFNDDPNHKNYTDFSNMYFSILMPVRKIGRPLS
jgi:hypothetical protein